MLYPIKFKPVFKEKVWGGEKIRTSLGLDFAPLPNCGEVWALSGVAECQTVISNGFLAGNELNEVLEIYMDELVGEHVYERYASEFPLLIKYIDAADWLSIQVHPDDAMATRRNLRSGKTEMWYIMDADPGAQLISGFNRKMTPEIYLEYLAQNRLQEIMNYETVQRGDAFFIQAGRVHALGPGILLAEIQQTSDTTYRIYDWDRPGADGRLRELHADEALDAIDFSLEHGAKTSYRPAPDRSSTLADCPFFTTNLLDAGRVMHKDYTSRDSFVIYVCAGGQGLIRSGDEEVSLTNGEVVLLPATTEEVSIIPEHNIRILEVYVP